ncbi:hypothetical protein FQN54_000601 [Arachnomyces sp. PD_36]|nr:hypothetical protein FQN54_000601 [Arachnomyces sp. PD_36]
MAEKTDRPVAQNGHDEPSAGNQLSRVILQHEKLLLQLKNHNEIHKRKEKRDTDGSMGGEVFDRSDSYDPQSEVGKRIDQFLACAEKVPPPIKLTGARNYLAWREDIFVSAERVKVHYMLSDNEQNTPRPKCEVESLFWSKQENWLYFFIWDSLGPQVKPLVKRPSDRSAYGLWKHLESTFRMPKRLVIDDVIGAIKRFEPSKDYEEDLERLKTYQEVFVQLDKLGVKEHFLKDLFKYLHNGLSKPVSRYLDQKKKDDPKFFETVDFLQLTLELSFRLTSVWLISDIDKFSSDSESDDNEGTDGATDQGRERKRQRLN